MSKSITEKFEQAVRLAFKIAYKIVDEETPPETHPNSKAVAAAELTSLFIEVDLDAE